MDAEIAVIGGVGFTLEGIADEVDTAYGPVPAVRSGIKSQRLAFIPRHGTGHLPPHKVDYRAIISAAKKIGAQWVISVNSVGGMASQPVGSFFFPYDFVEFTKCRSNTFYEDRAVHIDLSEPYCPHLRGHLLAAAKSLDLETSEGVYVCAEGPHLETPAQIRMMRQFGDVVGMTGYPEVALAREAQLCYASICIITNPAAGMGGSESLSASDIPVQVKKCHQDVREIIYQAAQKLDEKRSCHCRESLSEAAL
jgi:5'-methylthioadenosine phosphorylase